MNRAIVLLSGGLDSATCFLIAKKEAEEVFALSFDYAQRHKVELERARSLAETYGAAAHRVVKLDLPARESSALTDLSRDVPRHALGAEAIPITYVPARNTLFLSNAVAWGEAIGAGDLYIGANSIDYSGYPDCRPEFLESFERTANLGTKSGVEGEMTFRIHAPLLRMTKGEIVSKARDLGLNFALTSSCYDPAPDGEPCRSCDSCLLREIGFREAGVQDPLHQPPNHRE
jgi:7-cyano-7-deazaguanine synthase